MKTSKHGPKDRHESPDEFRLDLLDALFLLMLAGILGLFALVGLCWWFLGDMT
jgi:hypothetical protein